jgi:hypothetical protein
MEIYQVFAYFFFCNQVCDLLLNEIIVKREALSQKFSPSKIVG